MHIYNLGTNANIKHTFKNMKCMRPCLGIDCLSLEAPPLLQSTGLMLLERPVGVSYINYVGVLGLR